MARLDSLEGGAERSSDTIFGAIVRGEVEADIVYEDHICVAFRDVAPQAPTHVLVVPRLPVEGLHQAEDWEVQLLGYLLRVARRVAESEGIEESGWRVVINVGEDAGQTVQHLHLHVLGGRKLAWPPG